MLSETRAFFLAYIQGKHREQGTLFPMTHEPGCLHTPPLTVGTAYVRYLSPPVTPAMQAGLTDHVWTIEELCNLLPEPIAAKSTIDNELLLKALSEAK